MMRRLIVPLAVLVAIAIPGAAHAAAPASAAAATGGLSIDFSGGGMFTDRMLQIIALITILSVAPSGFQLTQEVVALIQAIEAAFTAGQTPASHQETVASALGAHLAKTA